MTQSSGSTMHTLTACTSDFERSKRGWALIPCETGPKNTETPPMLLSRPCALVACAILTARRTFSARKQCTVNHFPPAPQMRLVVRTCAVINLDKSASRIHSNRHRIMGECGTMFKIWWNLFGTQNSPHSTTHCPSRALDSEMFFSNQNCLSFKDRNNYWVDYLIDFTSMILLHLIRTDCFGA